MRYQLKHMLAARVISKRFRKFLKRKRLKKVVGDGEGKSKTRPRNAFERKFSSVTSDNDDDNYIPDEILDIAVNTDSEDDDFGINTNLVRQNSEELREQARQYEEF